MSEKHVLNSRLGFIGLDKDRIDSIRRIKPLIMQALPKALDGFYDKVSSEPETRRFFSGKPAMDNAKSRQLNHWDRISSGQFDDGYVEAVTTVGQVHARIGLEPRWYIGGYATLLSSLISAVVEARWPKGGLGMRKAAGGAELSAELGALVRATLLDMDYAISVYLEAAEAHRKATEAAVLAQERAVVVDRVGEGMKALADGDLAYRMSGDIPTEYARLRDDFNLAMDHLQETMSAVVNGSEAIQSGTHEIAQASDDLSRRTEQQAASLEETAAALDEITATVRKTAEGALRASESVTVAKADAAASGQIVSDAVSAMSEIEGSSKEISQIIGVIDEIAFQTNLLALNAGVEAARAGEAGRGFAVVASEVRALAQRSAEAAKEIKKLITASSGQVDQGVTLVRRTGQTLASIVDKVGEIDILIREISASAQEQSEGLDQVNIAVNEMDKVVQQNAAMVEQSTAATHSLRAETVQMAKLIAQFRTGQETKAPAPRAAEQARGGPPPRPAGSPVHAMTRRLASAVGAPASDGWEEF